MTRRGLGLFVLMSVVWGLPYMLIKVAVRDLSPAMVVEGRTAIGAAVLLPLAIRQGELRPLLRSWRPLLAYTLAELAIPWYLLSSAERRLPSSLSGLLVATVPLQPPEAVQLVVFTDDQVNVTDEPTAIEAAEAERVGAPGGINAMAASA